MTKNKDIWASFEYEPRFNSLSIVPEQKKIVICDTKSGSFYFNSNPYGESCKSLIENIELKNNGVELIVQNNKPIKVAAKNNIGSILIDILLDLKKNNFETSKLDKDHIQLTFLNNILYRLDIKKYENNIVVNNLILLFKNNQLYVDFNGPRFLIKKINLIENEICFETCSETFIYKLDNQNMMNNYLKSLINESTNLESIHTITYNNKEEQIIQISNNNNNYYQIQYNPYFNYMFFSNNKTTFFYLFKKKIILFYSDELGIREFSTIIQLKSNTNNGLLIELENNQCIKYDILYNIDEEICNFLLLIKSEDIFINTKVMDKFTLLALNGNLSQFRIYEIDNKQQIVKKMLQLFINNQKIISRINEIESRDVLGVKIINDIIMIKTEKEEFLFELTMPSVIVNLLRNIFKKSMYYL